MEHAPRFLPYIKEEYWQYILVCVKKTTSTTTRLKCSFTLQDPGIYKQDFKCALSDIGDL